MSQPLLKPAVGVAVGDQRPAVLDRMREQLHRDITVAEVADRAAMSQRTFARRFEEETGATPFRWLPTQRLQRAQELLETTDLDIDRVAAQAGFGTGANLREHFRPELATSPTAYRRCFRGTDDGSAAHATPRPQGSRAGNRV